MSTEKTEEQIKAEKFEKAMREDFALHVSLIKRADSCSASEAKFKAWCEGPKGLVARLGGK